MSIDLVESHLKSRQLGNLKFDNFDDVLPKLLNYFSKNKVTDWSKPGCRTTYNNIKIFEILGFNLTINKIDGKTKAEVKLKYKKNKISVKILVRLQDFFQYKVVEYLREKSQTISNLKPYFKRHELIDSNEIEILTDDIKYNVKEDTDLDEKLVNDDKFMIEDRNYCDFNNYRVDMLLHISGKYYICIEFFENHHKNPNEVDLSNELHRIMSLVYNNKSRNKKIVHVGVYWESNINNESIFNKFMDTIIIDKINKYLNIENEEEYIINEIQKELGCDKQVADMLFQSNEEWNKPVIWLDKLNDKIIHWKKGLEKECKEKVFRRFIKKIDQFQTKDNIEEQKEEISDEFLDNIDCNSTRNKIQKVTKIEKIQKMYYDRESNKLTNFGLTLYISYILTSNVLNSIEDEEWWNEFNAKITRGFINGLKKIRKESLQLTDKFMSGLYDCY
jgi:hypothetical protein